MKPTPANKLFLRCIFRKLYEQYCTLCSLLDNWQTLIALELSFSTNIGTYMANDFPHWLQNEDVAFYDDDEFAVIKIDNLYFPLGRFSGHITLGGLHTLKDAKQFSQNYYTGK